MQDTQLSQISNFIWGVADDYLRDLYVRGKYRDVILPMTVLRRLDAVLDPTKEKVLEEKKWLDEAGISEQSGVLEQAAGQAFYNTSPFQLKDLTSRATQQQLRDDFNAYLDGFSPNVQDILEKFEFRNQINRLSDGDVLGSIVNRFLSTQINLSPEPVLNADGSVRHPGLDNHAMGTIFEDLVRRFNEDNNEEAGEHWTPRDAVELMAQLVFQPVRDQHRVRHLPALRRGHRHRRHADHRGADPPGDCRQRTPSRSLPTSTGRRSTTRPTRSARPTCS